ncbi:GNAT family N-acetyltransferase [Streptomonospora salina]|uniref:Ribosomal protein S18 acetylase RimI-like enzyme n=1 Tax=Streptomonospora salina TaxID=104205 RepID=A0A841EB31_9ACTN|nr:GNAT family N-acetyltransferase [Streptomonospora salina]MBB5996671.1 ribosomal protein S18 acetylase RimI-like enzyme [Streptomonospora salina]
MPTPPDPTVRAAAAEDAGEIWTLQRAAFVDEAQLYGDPFVLALAETLDNVRSAIARGHVRTAVEGTRIVGAVRGRAEGGTGLVSRLCVAPDRRRRGIARALMRSVEERLVHAHPDVAVFAAVTGQQNATDLRLYRGLGYAETHRERMSEHVALVHMRKAVPGREPRPAGV